MLGLVTEISDRVQPRSPNPLHIRDGLGHSIQCRQPRIRTSRGRNASRSAFRELTSEHPQMRTELAQRRKVNLENVLIARHRTPPLGKHPR